MLYAIALEALNNALKHAHSKVITVQLQRKGSMIELSITDEGVGFEQDIVKNQGGIGLTSMAERAIKLGGALQIDSVLTKGTTVVVKFRRGSV